MPQVGAEDPPGAREALGQKELQVLKEGGLGCVHKPAGNEMERTAEGPQHVRRHVSSLGPYHV